jgi:hypothetical protein
LLFSLGVVTCGMKAAQKTEATPMRTSARELNPPFFTYTGFEIGD